MPELLDALTKEVEASPRRGVLRTLASVGLGAIIGARGAPSIEARRKGKNGNKGKNRCEKCPSCDACPNCDECSRTCSVVLTGVGGEKICAESFSWADCRLPCTSNSQCRDRDPNHPHCVVEQESLATGEKLTLGCKGSPPGMCGAAIACVS
jgi:hypothetical protein